jgi:hypothetical protein
MNSLQEILQQAQRDLYCPTCGRNFSLSEIRLRGLFNHTLLLQTVCTNGHSPVIMIFVANYNQSEQLKPITTDDVLATHVALKNFKGDFKSLWSKKKE